MIFGDPDDGDAVGSIPAAKVDVICHDGDNICDGGIIVLPAHLTVSSPPSVTFNVSTNWYSTLWMPARPQHL